MIVPLIAAAAAIWLASLVAAPLLPVPLAGALYALGSHICHQRPDRSFHLLSSQVPVCARCLGIYTGAAAGSLIAAVYRPGAWGVLSSRTLLFAGAAPTAVTLVVEWSGTAGTSNMVRAMSGVLLGCAVALVVARAAATLHYGGCALRRPIASNRPPTPI